MATITGITDFLNQAGTQFKVFDMGRRIQQLDADVFFAFEQGEQAYPYPLQQQAWLGIMVWGNKTDDLVIWFLRFPLDATGKLTAGIRDDFVTRLIQKDDKQSTDDSTPYGFKPKQEHMATFHAKAAKVLAQSGSRFYAHAQDYFSGKTGFDQWAFVGYQGIADMACRLDEDKNIIDLIQALPQVPPQPFEALCQCLEHEVISDELVEVLGQCLDTELSYDEPNPNFISLLLRAISGASNQALCEQQILKVLHSPQGSHAEVLASISGRCWLCLKQPSVIQAFLENLAQCSEGQEFFNLVIVDLINIPGMQDSIHQGIRNKNRSETLSNAIGELLKQFT
jgi:Protein of unknown function (DUF3549)